MVAKFAAEEHLKEIEDSAYEAEIKRQAMLRNCELRDERQEHSRHKK
jgi:hypothetical protein